eukprot:1486402-Amphidinium_carterae.1
MSLYKANKTQDASRTAPSRRLVSTHADLAQANRPSMPAAASAASPLAKLTDVNRQAAHITSITKFLPCLFETQNMPD